MTAIKICDNRTFIICVFMLTGQPAPDFSPLCSCAGILCSQGKALTAQNARTQKYCLELLLFLNPYLWHNPAQDTVMFYLRRCSGDISCDRHPVRVNIVFLV